MYFMTDIKCFVPLVFLWDNLCCFPPNFAIIDNVEVMILINKSLCVWMHISQWNAESMQECKDFYFLPLIAVCHQPCLQSQSASTIVTAYRVIADITHHANKQQSEIPWTCTNLAYPSDIILSSQSDDYSTTCKALLDNFCLIVSKFLWSYFQTYLKCLQVLQVWGRWWVTHLSPVAASHLPAVIL